MKKILTPLVVTLLLVFAFPYSGSAQDSVNSELKYEVYRVYPYISISAEKLKDAQTLSDLNKYSKSSWVKEFISVDVLASFKGVIRKVSGKSDLLNPEQKEMMNMADVGTEISVKVRYVPKNTLAQSDTKEINFTFTVDPEKEASFSGGDEMLNQYLKVNAIDKIPDGIFRQLTLAAVKFAIDEEGHIVDAHVFESSKDKVADDLLLTSILNMPKWEAAEYANGTNVKQEFVLTVGDMENCMVNLLNIRQD